MRRFWTTADLRAEGRTRRDIALLVDAGRIEPVRVGLFAAAGTPVDLVRAARTGGAATATTASRALGLWTPPDDRLQIAARPSSGHLRDPDDAMQALGVHEGVCVHWTQRMPNVRTLPDRIAPLLLVLEHTLRCLRPEYAVAVLDSALNTKQLWLSQLPALRSMLPQHLRHLVDATDWRADSGLESIVRHLLREAGFDVVVHPVLGLLGQVDLLVGGRLIIETDGRKHHTPEEAFENDRRRDREAALMGHRVLRLTYRQVIEEWPTTMLAIRAILAQTA